MSTPELESPSGHGDAHGSADSPGQHSHSHSPLGHHAQANGNARRLRAALALAGVYLIAEVVGGIWTGSLALIADAGHMLSDVASLTLALIAIRLAQRPANIEQTFGYHRAEVLAAFANAIALIGIGIFIVFEAIERFAEPTEVLAGPMFGIATGGLVVNVLALLILHGGESGNLNMRGALLHVLADALGSVGAMTSGALIWAFDWRWADPAASLLISALVIGSALTLLRSTIHVLMQSAPARLDMGDLKARLEADEAVVSVHDLHAWTLASGRELVSVHVVTEDAASWPTVLERLTPLSSRNSHRGRTAAASSTNRRRHPADRPIVRSSAPFRPASVGTLPARASGRTAQRGEGSGGAPCYAGESRNGTDLRIETAGPPMIGYVTLGTNDIEKAAAFYDVLLAELGAKRMMETESFIAWSVTPEGAALSVTKPFDQNAATLGNGVMVALSTSGKEQVDAIYAKAIELGGADEGKPGPRGDGFYAGYFRDLDGNKLNAFFIG